MVELVKKNKRGIDDVWNPTQQELSIGINNIPDTEIRSCCALIYLTGNRVSEIVGIPQTEKDRKLGREGYWKIPPVRKSAFTYSERNIGLVKLNTFTLKRSFKRRHEYVFDTNDPHEASFWKLVKDRLDEIKDPDDFPWNVSRYRVWKALEASTAKPEMNKSLSLAKATIKASGMTPHKLRSLRATRDAVEYNLDALALKAKFNWGSAKMPFKYASMNVRDIEDKIARKGQ